ncbi:MAG: hypothetical protein D8H99_28770 [Streptococcus sp.]|jgi:hypothetical protein|nr:MAG: hypothetical protein D8H99_28770 [Streptococcus sp.]
MNLYVKINYPNVESPGDLLTVEKCTKEGDMSLDEILELYRQFERQGYRVSTKIDTKDLMIDPFEFANNLERAGINYTSTLNIKDKGTYDMIHPVASIIENYGFDYDVAILLKINDESTVNFDREGTWMSPTDAEYQIKSKARTKNIAELQGLYESLANTNVTSEIIVTPKSPKVEDEVESILSLCQEGTVVKFTLKDAE